MLEKSMENKGEVWDRLDQLDLAKNILLAEPLDIGTDILEIGLDHWFQSEIITEVPVLGSLIRAGKTIASINDMFFIKKVLTFVKAIHDQKEIEGKWKEHREKLIHDKKLLNKEIEIILIYLDKQTHYVKSQILGSFYSLYFKKKIDWEEFQILAEILEMVSVFDLATLRELYNERVYHQGKRYNKLALKRLSSSGLVDYFNGMLVTAKGQRNEEPHYAEITELGDFFVEYGLVNINW